MTASDDVQGARPSNATIEGIRRKSPQFKSDLSGYRASAREQERVADLLSLVPSGGRAVLDAGARDGHLSRMLRGRFKRIVALDLKIPSFDDPGILLVQSDITALPFDDDSFDVVLCAEVLEHIPPPLLAKACTELSRVTRGSVVIGVPYRQDLRYGRTTCQACGWANPPWGHVNSFDEQYLAALFAGLTPVQTSYVGKTREYTNGLSAALFQYAGNPYGTYRQEESCVHCGSALGRPPARTVLQRCATRVATIAMSLQQYFGRSHANWMHTRFDKAHGPALDVPVDRP